MKGARNILFWGAAWGVLEATLGWGLHLIHFKGEALVLYPFGLACMMAAARQCGTLSMSRVALQVAAVAALIKLVNLFTWPGVPAYYVTNPAVAIFLEGLVTFVFCKIVERRTTSIPSPVGGMWMAFILILGSFAAFKGWQITMDTLTTYNPDAHLFMSKGMMWTWIWRSAVQALMLVAAVRIALQWTPSERWQLQTARWSLPILVVAVFATIYL